MTLLPSLCEQIGEAYGITGELPMDFIGVARVFQERLRLATSDRPLVVFWMLRTNSERTTRSLAHLVGRGIPAALSGRSLHNGRCPGAERVPPPRTRGLPQADAATALDHWFEHLAGLQPAQRNGLLQHSAAVGCRCT